MLVHLQVDEDGSKEIEFAEFVKVIQINKAMSEKCADEQETLDAFVALGGNVREGAHARRHRHACHAICHDGHAVEGRGGGQGLQDDASMLASTHS